MMNIQETPAATALGCGVQEIDLFLSPSHTRVHTFLFLLWSVPSLCEAMWGCEKEGNLDLTSPVY